MYAVVTYMPVYNMRDDKYLLIDARQYGFIGIACLSHVTCLNSFI